MVVKILNILLLLVLASSLKVTTKEFTFLQDDDNTSENDDLQYYLNGITDFPGYETYVIACSGGTCQTGIPLTDLQAPNNSTPTNPATNNSFPTYPPTSNQFNGYTLPSGLLSPPTPYNAPTTFEPQAWMNPPTNQPGPSHAGYQ